MSFEKKQVLTRRDAGLVGGLAWIESRHNAADAWQDADGICHLDEYVADTRLTRAGPFLITGIELIGRASICFPCSTGRVFSF